MVCPTVFLYGKYIADEQYCERAIGHLEKLKAEKNKIIRMFKSIGVNCSTAADSQALIQLKKSYCNEKQCMSCAIGSAIIKQKR